MNFSITDMIDRVWNRGRTDLPEPETRTIYVPVRQAGVNVTYETSLGMSAVWACVRAISEPIASMPWRVMEEMPNGKLRRANEQSADWVIHKEPNPEMTPFTWRETMIAWALTWGNGYAEIVRDRAGRIAELWLLSPDRVEPQRTDSGRLVYEIHNYGSASTILEANDVFHLHGLGFDGLKGYSVIEMHRKNFALGMALREAGTSTFANSSAPSGIVKYAGRLDAETADRTREEWNKLYSGPNHRGRIAVMGGDADFKPISIPLQDAQFVENCNLQTEEVCRIFRVQPHKVQHLLRSTNNNIEHQAIEFVQDTLMPWVLRLEQEGNRKLFGRNQRSRFYTKINLDALLRGDSSARAEFYNKMWNMGVLNANEIREKEDMGNIGTDGDKRFVQLNMTTLDKAGEQIEQPQPAAKTPVEPEDDDAEQSPTNRLNGSGSTNGRL